MSDTDLVVNNDILYVEMDGSGIHPLVVATELPVTLIDGESKTYLKVTEVIAWYEKESKAGKLHDLQAKLLGAFKNLQKRFDTQLAADKASGKPPGDKITI